MKGWSDLTLYHITDKRNVDSIMKHGLIPKIGSRSKGIEDEPRVYLTEREYLEYWKILLGRKNIAVFKTEFLPDDFNEYNYSDYKEIRTETVIPADELELIEFRSDRNLKREAMRKLCKSRIWTISWLCENCARFYTNGVKKTFTWREIHDFLVSECQMLKRLDYSVLTLDEKREILKDFGEGGHFTFLDTYLNTDKKLYQLSMYSDPYTYEIRNKFEKLITEAFNGCLDMSTGGWIDVQ